MNNYLRSEYICPVCKDKMLSHGPGKVLFYCYKNTCQIELEQRSANIYKIDFRLNNKPYRIDIFDFEEIIIELFYYEGFNRFYLYGFKSEKFDLEYTYNTSIKFINNLIFM